VKNVAGYDMCKLFTGSRGSLGLIAELTLKLRPRPAREATLIVSGAKMAALCEIAGEIRSQQQLLPVAIELLSAGLARAFEVANHSVEEGESILLLRFAGSEPAVAAQLAHARRMIKAQQLKAAETNDDESLWQSLAAATERESDSLIWRAGTKPTGLPTLIVILEQTPSQFGAATTWQAGLGNGRLRIFHHFADDHVMPFWSERLRQAASDEGGYLVLEKAPVGFSHADSGPAFSEPLSKLMRDVKRQLDPHDGLIAICE
ncbi:MAG: hypothetical protein M3Q76_03040, partial [Acidobacteriota bacterium]|nr:hypothetical protein [Acidobacteriota bacterium]